MTLYHFTCTDHGEPGIRKHRTILPFFHPFLGRQIAWFTDDPAPDLDDAGLTSNLAACDRTAYRVTVAEQPGLVRWLDSDTRCRAPRTVVADLESLGRPETWWISHIPIKAGDIVRRPKEGWT